MIARETFKVGDKVCVVTRSEMPFRISKVVRIGKRKITLEDKSGWTLDGYEWGLGLRRTAGPCAAHVSVCGASTIAAWSRQQGGKR